MITIGQIISDIRNDLKLVDDDRKITNKYLWSLVKRHLRWLIKRESDKLKLLSYDNLFQTLKCVDVIEAPAIDDCCGVKSRCVVFRTKYKIPPIYESVNGVIIKSVFTIDGGMDFGRITVKDYLRKLEKPDSKYDKSIYYFYNNGYLYFPNSRIRSVMVKAYFEDEDDVIAFNDCDTSQVDPCRSKLDQDARIPAGISGELMQFVTHDLLPQQQIPDDNQIDKNTTNKR